MDAKVVEKEFLLSRFSGNVRSNRLVHKSTKSKTKSVGDVPHFLCCQGKQRRRGV